MRLIRLAWPPQLGWQRLLLAHGAVLFSASPCMADHRALHTLASLLGPASRRAEARHSALRGADAVQSVRALEDDVKDRHGQPLRSAGAGPIALHTDEAFLLRPCRWLLLQCWQPDPAGGGETQLCDGPALYQQAGPRLRRAMQRPIPLAEGRFAFISTDGSIRFNPELAALAAAQGNSAGEDLEAITAVAEAAETSCLRLQLEAGDLLLLDNARILHGRSGFDPSSTRLLKRLRLLDAAEAALAAE